ncbi:MAG: cation:proton antiporter [Candidatus Latescibacteria bacterium]|nr:cation:proton antiporter [Candidatus Latescibacterota bacterium]
MLNLISFLLMVMITIIRIRSGYESNPLLDAGLLILLGYTLSLLMKYFGLPGVFGYVFAGIAAGDNGLGFISETFVENIVFVEIIVVMLAVSVMTKKVFSNLPNNEYMKNLIIGTITSTAAFALTIGFIAPLQLQTGSKIVCGLFASVFSPLIMFAAQDNKSSNDSALQIAFGGMITAIIFWGVVTAYAHPENPDRVKLAFMPVILGATSAIAGFVWAYVTEKLIYDNSPGIRNIYPLAIIFLIYPLINFYGLDVLLLAIGIGLYNGVISNREQSFIENSQIPMIIVFTIFGTRLSMEKMVALGNPGWMFAIILTIFLLFTKTITILISRKVFSLPSLSFPGLSMFVPYGPLSILIMGRFLPKLRVLLKGEISGSSLYSVFILSIVITIIISIFLNILVNLFCRKEHMG